MTEQEKKETIGNKAWRLNNLYLITDSDGTKRKLKMNKSQIQIMERLSD